MSREIPEPHTLARQLEPLFRAGEMPLADAGLEPDVLRELGFDVSAERVRIPDAVERLDATAIRRNLSARANAWVTELVIHEVVGSTNAILNELARERSIHGIVQLAELQVQGRGRRGKSWISPYANNLAVSAGAGLAQPTEQLGGFSLCIGLAVADSLTTLGIEGVELKWPNDVLIDGRKVAGILIELHRTNRGTTAVIGVGLNIRLPVEVRAAIDQPVADLSEVAGPVSRNRLAGLLVSSLVDYVEGFEEGGFEPMRETFDRLHRFHQRQCVLLLGDDLIRGTVRGVSPGGELLLETDGAIQAFGAGEVSLRPGES